MSTLRIKQFIWYYILTALWLPIPENPYFSEFQRISKHVPNSEFFTAFAHTQFLLESNGKRG